MIEAAESTDGTIVFPEGNDDRILEAARRLVDDDILNRVLILGCDQTFNSNRIERINPEGSEWSEDVRTLLDEKLEDDTSSDIEQLSHDPLFFAAALVELNLAQGMVAGSRHPTAEVLRAALKLVGTRGHEDVVSSSFIMEVNDESYGTDGTLVFSDPAVLPSPDSDELVDIASGAVRTYRDLVGEDEPKVAFLSFSTRGSAEHEAVDKVRSALDGFRSTRPDVDADGELQVDAALVPEVAERKAPDSEVAGRANVLIFPDLDAANIGYKLVQWLGDAGAYGPFLQGLDGVVNDLSRGCSIEDIVTVSAVSVLQARDQ